MRKDWRHHVALDAQVLSHLLPLVRVGVAQRRHRSLANFRPPRRLPIAAIDRRRVVGGGIGIFVVTVLWVRLHPSPHRLVLDIRRHLSVRHVLLRPPRRRTRLPCAGPLLLREFKQRPLLRRIIVRLFHCRRPGLWLLRLLAKQGRFVDLVVGVGPAVGVGEQRVLFQQKLVEIPVLPHVPPRRNLSSAAKSRISLFLKNSKVGNFSAPRGSRRAARHYRTAEIARWRGEGGGEGGGGRATEPSRAQPREIAISRAQSPH